MIERNYSLEQSLRSSSQSRLHLPSTDNTNKKHLGARAFKSAAPKLWNSLPDSVRNAETVGVFRQRLKTYLFPKKSD